MQVVDRHQGHMVVKTSGGLFFVVEEPKMPNKRNALGHFKSEKKAPVPTMAMLEGKPYVFTLSEARKLLGKTITHPVKETQARDTYVINPHRKGN